MRTASIATSSELPASWDQLQVRDDGEASLPGNCNVKAAEAADAAKGDYLRDI